MSLDFPWQLFAQTQEQRRKAQELQQQNIAGIGQSLGDIGETIGKYKAQGALQKALLAYRNGGVAPSGPVTAGMDGAMTGAAPQAQGQTPDVMQLSQLFGRAYPGQSNPFQTAVSEQFDPLKQSQIRLNNVKATNAGMKSGLGQTITKYYDPTTGEYSPIQKPGFQPVTIPATEDYRYFNEGKARDQKAGEADAKATLKDWRDIADQTNPFMSKGMGGSQTVFARAARANQAAARGLKTLNSKDLTWNELNGFVNSDLASIFAGGGAPHDLQLHQAEYSNVMNKLGNMKQFFTGKPSGGLVPPETRAHIQTLVQEIIDTDNEIIDNQIEYVRSKYADRISQNPERFNRYVEKASKIKTVGTISGAMAQPAAPSSDVPIVGGTFNGQKVVSVTPL